MAALLLALFAICSRNEPLPTKDRWEEVRLTRCACDSLPRPRGEAVRILWSAIQPIVESRQAEAKQAAQTGNDAGFHPWYQISEHRCYRLPGPHELFLTVADIYECGVAHVSQRNLVVVAFSSEDGNVVLPVFHADGFADPVDIALWKDVERGMYRLICHPYGPTFQGAAGSSINVYDVDIQALSCTPMACLVYPEHNIHWQKPRIEIQHTNGFTVTLVAPESYTIDWGTDELDVAVKQDTVRVVRIGPRKIRAILPP